MYGYIYKTTNLINNKIYIGLHKTNLNKLDESYLGSGKLLIEAINKYGRDNFKCEIILWCESLEELNLKEIYYIEFYKSKCTFGNYNMSDGGWVPRLSGELNGNYGKHRPHTEDEKLHLSKVMIGHKPTFTRKHTLEERIKMSAAGKLREHNLLYKDYSLVSKANTGKKFMNNGFTLCWVNKEDIDKYLSNGWVFGACKKRKLDSNKIKWNIGTKAINNGIVNKFIPEKDLDTYLNQGWNLGWIKKI